MTTPAADRQERSRETRATLISVARGLFAERGYAGTSIGEVLSAAGFSKGALYHHFPNKRALFRAVYEQVDAEIAERSMAAAAAVADPWEQLRAALDAFLDLSVEPAMQRIAFIDAPSVLGWSTWRAIDDEHGLGALKASLDGLMDRGYIARQPVDALAHLLLGALSEAGLLVARSDDTTRTRSEVGAAVEQLLEGIRIRPG